MRTKSHRLIAMIVVLAALCSMMMPVSAANTAPGISPQASYYITSVYAYATGGTGSITVTFNMTATGKMTSLGAQKVRIYDANDTLVKTFDGYTTAGMLSSGYSYSSSVTYNGAKSGAKYYAVVTFKASNSTGGDSDTYTTGYATAK